MSACVHFALFVALSSSTYSYRRVAKKPEGVNLGPDVANPSHSLPAEFEPESSGVLAAMTVASSEFKDDFEEKTFEQQADHINAYHQQPAFLNSTVATFPQRYWINTKAWGGAGVKAPILVELSVFGGFFMWNDGFIAKLSRDLGAMVVVIESRFTGDSTPFNESGWTKRANRVGLLSTENILRDVVMLVSNLRDTYDPDWVCPTGSLGVGLSGDFAARLRQKFPNVVDFAVSSAAVMQGYPGTADPYAFAKAITEIWWELSGRDEDCMELIRESFDAMSDTDCYWWLYLAVYEVSVWSGYYRPDKFQGFCQAAADLKANGGSAVDVALSFCGEKCKWDGARCPTRDYPDEMWSYLRCTEEVYPIGFNGITDFMRSAPFQAPFDVSQRASECLSRWGVETPYGGKYHTLFSGWHRLPQLADSISRIVFIYGEYDPWKVFAPSMTDISDEIPVIIVKGGSHGAEWHDPWEHDTADMLAAREKLGAHVKRWVEAVQTRGARVTP